MGFLLLCSLFFYGWWKIEYVPLLVFTGLIDFLGAFGIQKWEKFKRIFLILSLSVNLGVLFYFKYFNFFIDVFVDLQLFKSESFDLVHLMLPIGLSFYTFQSMSYVIDVYRGRMEATKNPLLFFAFISFFPHLVAGPIVRAKEIFPQLIRVKKITETERFHAFKLIVIGYFKKTVLADHLASFVQEAYGSKEMIEGSNYWYLILVAFSFQIYFDFSGYTDIARGLAKNFGVHFRMNFNHPYLSTSFKMFWSRWHISLSTWFRDYVYIPLGGNKKGKWHGIKNMWITMLLSGIWHGANYTFIIWGGIHAFLLSLERIFKLPKKMDNPILKLLQVVFVFLFASIAWVFFRANSVEQAFLILKELVSFSSFQGVKTDAYFNSKIILKLAIVVELFIFFKLGNIYIIKKNKNALENILLACMLFCILFFRGPGEQFIYFQF